VPRAAILIFQNEFRLLAKDRVGIFMLVLAPIVIIAVAGFSLGNIYGASPGRRAYLIPLVNEDRGVAADAIAAALKREPSIQVMMVENSAAARRIVAREDRAPLAIVIPRGMTESLALGRPARLIVYADPIKRIEVSAIELNLGELCASVTSRLQDRARTELTARADELRARLERLNSRFAEFHSAAESYRRRLLRMRTDSRRAIDARLRLAMEGLREQIRAQARESAAETRTEIDRQLAPRRQALADVNRYVGELQASERRFDQWLAELKQAAGSRASRIPPPPAWPAPPDPDALAELSKPLDVPVAPPPSIAAPKLAITLAPMPPFPDFEPVAGLDSISGGAPALPGTLGWTERSPHGGGTRVNAFDQYVPGFGITFLLIGMLMGISLGLIDERDWGTLQRLRVSGAPLAGIVIGKLLSRFLIGLGQMVVLFVIGWWLFGISLGRYPAMLLLPAIAISFAAASFGLIIACIARTHDSVMPVGAVVAMAMSAIGGCWWPIDFEPSWMRAIAQWMPTTWTMRAFNDLMIRGSPPASVLWPSAAVLGLGLIYLCAGLAGTNRLYNT
jgi:ABC-type multidrug transport system permease subunit